MNVILTNQKPFLKTINYVFNDIVIPFEKSFQEIFSLEILNGSA